MPMNWNKLLNSTRVRTLYGGPDSIKSSNDPRSEFDRDYGRSVFSTPVRRLQDKAQVFPLVENDSVRTRLTHSMEVSSVARGLGAMVAKWLVEQNELKPELAPAVEVVCATCGIVHDLGNPPFGHAGEDSIAEWCNRHLNLGAILGGRVRLMEDFKGWNGNAQTIRLIGRLQVLSDEYGLNLTCATLSAACKYLAPSDNLKTGQHDFSKVGYFFSENDLVSKVRDAVGTGEARHPLTLLVEASDDIVYSAVDLEDGIKKRLITWDRLTEQLREKAAGCVHTTNALNLARKKIGTMAESPAKDEKFIQAFRTYAINEATISAFEEFKKSYKQIMDGTYHGELVKECTAKALVKACKDVARDVVYCCDEILELELMGRKVIKDLMTIFWEAAEGYSGKDWKGKSFAHKAYRLMSRNYRDVFEEMYGKVFDPARPETSQTPEAMYHRLQLVCDYISGMTDTFAVSLHRKLSNA
jgi:dGTPase